MYLRSSGALFATQSLTAMSVSTTATAAASVAVARVSAAAAAVPTKLEGSARTSALAALPKWSVVDGRDAIRREFTFADFNAAFGFMTRSALLAEQKCHHPEWFKCVLPVSATFVEFSLSLLLFVVFFFCTRIARGWFFTRNNFLTMNVVLLLCLCVYSVYNRVDVTLATHDCGGVSHNDIEMATAMDQYFDASAN
jgi:pterin-4a-carbinolamine dehydratase